MFVPPRPTAPHATHTWPQRDNSGLRRFEQGGPALSNLELIWSDVRNEPRRQTPRSTGHGSSPTAFLIFLKAFICISLCLFFLHASLSWDEHVEVHDAVWVQSMGRVACPGRPATSGE